MRQKSPPQKKILIVDDHAGIRDVFVFEMSGEFIVGEAADGEQALVLVERSRPDLIFLDILMPNLGGLAVLEHLRRRGFGDIPVVVMTGFHEVFPKEAAMAHSNVVAYLTKPFSYEGLAERVRQFIEAGVPARAQ